MFSEEKRENTSNSIKNPRIHSSIWYLIFPLTVIAILLVSKWGIKIATGCDRLRPVVNDHSIILVRDLSVQNRDILIKSDL